LILNGTIRQKREFALDTVNFSASVFSTNGTASASYDNALMQFDITAAGDTIIAAKLEIGTRQTLTKPDENGTDVLNDPPPNKALELAKCQRYFFRIAEYRATGYVMSATAVRLFIFTPVVMRITPALESGFIINQLICGGQSYDTSSLTATHVPYQMANNVMITTTFGAAHGAPSNQSVIYYAVHLGLSADL